MQSTKRESGQDYMVLLVGIQVSQTISRLRVESSMGLLLVPL